MGTPYLWELVSHHVADPPGLVLSSLAQGRHDQSLQVLLGQQGGDAHTGFHSQQTHRVLMGDTNGLTLNRGDLSRAIWNMNHHDNHFHFTQPHNMLPTSICRCKQSDSWNSLDRSIWTFKVWFCSWNSLNNSLHPNLWTFKVWFQTN